MIRTQLTGQLRKGTKTMTVPVFCKRCRKPLRESKRPGDICPGCIKKRGMY